MTRPDWVIIGGGVVGLSAAWQLAREGARVLVLEARGVGSGASSKAAGMLLPEVEAVRRPEVLPLLQESFELYPAFVRALEEDGRLSVGFRRTGCLAVAPREAFATAWPGLTPLSPEALAERQPGLGAGLAGSFFTDAGQVDAERLVVALARAAQRRGVLIRTGALVSEIRQVADRWLAVRTPDGWQEGGRFLLATGAWTESLARSVGADLGVYPLKGQMVEVYDATGLVETVVFGPDVYLCPKGDGRLLIGATVERVGFDEAVRAGAVARLLTAAERILPSVADMELRRSWVGFRPAREGLPYIDAIAQNALAAVGHFRDGILLTPVTVERVLRLARALG